MDWFLKVWNGEPLKPRKLVLMYGQKDETEVVEPGTKTRPARTTTVKVNRDLTRGVWMLSAALAKEPLLAGVSPNPDKLTVAFFGEAAKITNSARGSPSPVLVALGTVGNPLYGNRCRMLTVECTEDQAQHLEKLFPYDGHGNGWGRWEELCGYFEGIWLLPPDAA